jgi:hypothetical protein
MSVWALLGIGSPFCSQRWENGDEGVTKRGFKNKTVQKGRLLETQVVQV